MALNIRAGSRWRIMWPGAIQHIKPAAGGITRESMRAEAAAWGTPA
jgi:hypothetical protein